MISACPNIVDKLFELTWVLGMEGLGTTFTYSSAELKSREWIATPNV